MSRFHEIYVTDRGIAPGDTMYDPAVGRALAGYSDLAQVFHGSTFLGYYARFRDGTYAIAIARIRREPTICLNRAEALEILDDLDTDLLALKIEARAYRGLAPVNP